MAIDDDFGPGLTNSYSVGGMRLGRALEAIGVIPEVSSPGSIASRVADEAALR